MMHPVQFTFIEAVATLRYLRAVREGFRVDITQLEEKLKAHGDGATQGAILALAAEVGILDGTIRKLWVAIE